MSIEIRPFTPADYPACASIMEDVYPAYAASADEFRYRDEHGKERCVVARWMALLDGAAIGFGEFRHMLWAYHPRHFYVMIQVRHARRRLGAGSALYGKIIEEIAAYDPTELRTTCCETEDTSIAFLEKRGFGEEQRYWESVLDLRTFDPSPYDALLDGLERDGVTFRNLADIRRMPGWEEKLHDLIWEIEQDVPSETPATRTDRELFIKQLETDPGIVPEGLIVAVCGNAFVGMSNLRVSGATTDLTTGLTGTARAWRGRKIALAAKVISLAWAKSKGYPSNKTWNDSRNRRMLEINERLGFARGAAWVQFVKRLEPSGSTAAGARG